MTVILDDDGLPNWNFTSRMLRGPDIEWLGQYMKTMKFETFDFSPGLELAFQCPGCGRLCPHATAPVDHIIPRTGIKFEVNKPIGSLDQITYNGFSYRLHTEGLFWFLNQAHHPLPAVMKYQVVSYQDIKYAYHDAGPLFPVPSIEQPPMKRHRIRINDFLANDIENLQFMCASCNSKKSNNTIIPGQFRPQWVGGNKLSILKPH